jgi:hypothetical protein
LRIVGENLPGRGNSAQHRQPDVQKNQVRTERGGLLDRVESIGHFGDDRPSPMVLQRGTDVTAPQLMVIHDENIERHRDRDGAS